MVNAAVAVTSGHRSATWRWSLRGQLCSSGSDEGRGLVGGGRGGRGLARAGCRSARQLNQARSLPIQPSAKKTPASSFNLDGVQKSALILLDMQMIVLPHIKIMSFFNYRNEKGGGEHVA